jgi:hypothetical protein
MKGLAFISNANVNPLSAHATERNRLGAKKEQCGPGSSRPQHVPPSNHSSKPMVRRRVMSATARNAAGLLRQATVYGMLDSVEGRPWGGRKIWPGCVVSQNTPTRFARIFRLSFAFVTIPIPLPTNSLRAMREATLPKVRPVRVPKRFSPDSHLEKRYISRA